MLSTHRNRDLTDKRTHDRGTQAILTGDEFNDATARRFGIMAGTCITGYSRSRISVVPHHGTAGIVYDIITTPDGTSAIAAGNPFTYPV
jgi:hypothetical protein